MHLYYHYSLYLKTVLSKPGSIMLLCSELSRFLSTRMSPSLCAWSIFYMKCDMQTGCASLVLSSLDWYR